ncbi:TetR/AcrR family transcriptional regulator [Micromonospora zingiberis]|uniref:TetR/AcrR family transcriptional regulator n=1 Tax=Micromonospora zingiberis TaxID=2053011 RepID=UPI001F118A5B|nr:TetR/AcrR family transcriptional regulator [Micromonospora zingiberis]
MPAYHHGNLRTTLLAAAERSRRQHGADQLSLRELAREAGVSHAAPRRHFPDRQALLDALAEAGFARLDAELRAAAGEEFGPRLHAVAAAYLRFATEDTALLELMFTGKHREGAERLVAAAAAPFGLMDSLILQGQAQGVLEPGDSQRAGIVLFATVQGDRALRVRCGVGRWCGHYLRQGHHRLVIRATRGTATSRTPLGRARAGRPMPLPARPGPPPLVSPSAAVVTDLAYPLDRRRRTGPPRAVVFRQAGQVAATTT